MDKKAIARGMSEWTKGYTHLIGGSPFSTSIPDTRQNTSDPNHGVEVSFLATGWETLITRLSNSLLFGPSIGVVIDLSNFHASLPTKTKTGFISADIVYTIECITSSHNTEWSSKCLGHLLPSVIEEFNNITPWSIQLVSMAVGDIFVALSIPARDVL